LNVIALVLDLAGACVACIALVPLRDVAALVGTPWLRHAWHALILVVICCIVLLFSAAAWKYDKPTGYGDLAESGIHLLGPCFVLAVAWLSRRTAYDTQRMAALAEAASVDFLTGLANRRRFNERLNHEVKGSRNSGVPLSLIVIDVDHFKGINDTYGHAVGDLVLKDFAAALAAMARDTDTTCRVGGEEFAIIVPGPERPFVAAMAERLRLTIRNSVVSIQEVGDLSVSISVGMATLQPDDSPASLVKRADTALYAAKRAGRDRVSLAV
jgi:two-component system cell cycle response regulator